MSVNTFVWGFHRQLIKVIEVLQENQSITPKCWIARLWYSQHEQMKKYNILDRETFYSWDWTRKYKTELEKYTHAVEFNQKVYDKVYEKLWLFIDHCSRLDRKWTQRSIHYYLNHFNLLYHFFYSIFVKEQIQLVLMHHPHHMGIDTMIYEIAKALNIKIVIVTQSLIPDKFFYLDDINDYGNFHFMTKQEDVSDIKLEKKFFIDHWYMRNIKTFRFSIWEAIGRSILKPHHFFERFAFNYIRYLWAKRYNRNISRMVESVDYSKKYVYFPLHLQPELTTSVLGGVFCDQALALELLSKKLPKDWVIYVKENPKQDEFMRDEAFFTRLKLIDNLQMVPLKENTFKLMEHSQFVASITGTAGWEAICGGKPTLVFGKAWYQNFEGAFKWHNDIDISKIANYQIDHAKLERDYNQLISKMATGVVDPDYSLLDENYDEEKNFQDVAGFLAKLIKKVCP